MPALDDAILLAAQSHRGQTDEQGVPYILHPIRVMMAVQSEDEKMAAILHDVVEGTEVTLAGLRAAGYPEVVVNAVDSLSKRDGEPYEAYIARAKQNPLARRVKVADLEDNMDVRRLKSVEPRDFERLKRYHRAWLEMIGHEHE